MSRILSLFIGIMASLLVVASVAAQAPGADDLTILLASPGEGETFYVAVDGFMLSIPVSGQVVSYDDPLDSVAVDVTVKFIDSAGEASQVTVPLDESGRFVVWAAVQPPSQPFVSDDPHHEEECSLCHRRQFDLTLLQTVTQVVVSARAEDGRTGQVERHMYVDRSTHADLTVNIEGLPAHTDALQVIATTFIYDWRHRTFYGALADDQAIVSLERLDRGTLRYDVSMVPQIIGETRYMTPPQTVVVPGGDQALPSVTLQAQAQRGTLAGTVVDGISGAGVEASVLAVNLASGESHTTETDEHGSFLLTDLPIAEHVLLARSSSGFHLPQHIDLTESTDVTTRVHLTRAGTAVLSGTITLDGAPLPFAQATVDGLPVAYADPLTGAFELDGVDAEGPITVEITAAGCYGLRLETTEKDLGEIALTLRDDTQVVEKGGSRLYIPAQSEVTVEDDRITLARGVLWVRNVSASGAGFPSLSVGDYVLEGSHASFAVERIPNARARLYVIQDEVQVSDYDKGIFKPVMIGQTLVLEDDLGDPADMVAGSGVLLRAMAGSVASFEPAPSSAERVSRLALEILELIAKGFMLVAYGITFSIFPVILLLTAFASIWRKRVV